MVAIPMAAQSHHDPNLVQRRLRPDVSTVSPSENHFGGKDADKQLDKIERQTANSLAQSAPKQKPPTVPHTPAAEHHAPTASMETMPVHAQSHGLSNNSGSGTHRSAVHSARSRY